MIRLVVDLPDHRISNTQYFCALAAAIDLPVAS